MATERIIRTFSAADYAVFGVMLFVSAIIGIFYAVKDRKRNSDTEVYLMAGRSMGIIPIAMSLAISFMSAITVLGTPAEIYLNGTMYWWTIVPMLLAVLIVSEIHIPMYYKLNISSTYEYLEMRFNRSVRLLATVIYLIQTTLYNGIVIYVPSLALNQVTGFTLWGSVMTTGLVCTFYTTLGGLKGVIWVNVFQSLIMCGGFVAVIIRGSLLMGGFENIWRICEDGGRIDFIHFEMDFRIRHTFWGFVIGCTILYLAVFSTSQSQVQKYLSCKSALHAKLALGLNWICLVVILSLACMCGCVIYAYYKDCDPISKGCVGAEDQLLPFLVMEMFAKFPGIPGLFVACVYSGSLSTVSTGINAMATVTMEDFVKPFTQFQPNTHSWISKGAVILYGIASLGVAYMVSQLGQVLEASLSILGLVGGPLVGLFTLGLMIPFANPMGSFLGTLCGLGLTTWVYIGSKVYPTPSKYLGKLNVTSVCDGTCFTNSTNTFNYTIDSLHMVTTLSWEPSTLGEEEEDFSLMINFYHSSYQYISFFGFIGTIIVGLVVSLLSNGWQDRRRYNPRLLFHFSDITIFKWLPQKVKPFINSGVDVENKQQEPKKGCITKQYPMQNYKNKTISLPSNGENNHAYIYNIELRGGEI